MKRMLLWGEARGVSNFAKLCILWVLRNRATHRRSTMKTEALRPFQFSCFNHSDPNVSKLLVANNLEPVPWAACECVCDLFPLTKDPTAGADHYYVCEGPGAVAPKWGRGHSAWQERLITDHMVFGVAP